MSVQEAREQHANMLQGMQERRHEGCVRELERWGVQNGCANVYRWSGNCILIRDGLTRA